MVSPIFPSIVFVDLETTGATATRDRITEIGIVEITEQGEVREWSSLVNPQTDIPPFIQSLTGITPAMVAQAPSFEALASEVLSRLAGRLFVAHNARFDYGFLKHEFTRLGMAFKAPVLCTVKLSRMLFPEHSKHSLDALVERHGLHMPARHRALADAAVLWQFWQLLQAQLPPGRLHEAVGTLTGRSQWPSHLDPALLDELPEGHGVYLLHGAQGEVLHVGKSRNVRQGVLTHLSATARKSKAPPLAPLVRDVTWHACPGELGAALLEATLARQWRAGQNRRGKGPHDVCTWQLFADTKVGMDAGTIPGVDGVACQRPKLVAASEVDWSDAKPSYGLFGGEREALKTLREIAEGAQLCLATLGLEAQRAGQACAAHARQGCSGVCLGAEPIERHAERLRNVLADWQVRPWPYAGPVALGEAGAWHVVDAWRYLGTALKDADIPALREAARPAFDKDVYKLLVGALSRCEVRLL